ncbi:hypothetical protein IL992_02890 [Microbispora sp. NEAU-D428]|nr:hypothetical protein [Microbispora sitophila]
MSTSDLLAVQQKVPAIWAPSYGTDTLPWEPGRAVAEGRFHPVPLMVGGTAHEARYFVAMYFDGAGRPLNQETYRGSCAKPSAETRSGCRQGTRSAPTACHPWHGRPSPPTAPGHARPLAGNRLLARKTPVYQYEFADSDAPRPAGFPVPRAFPLGAYHGGELPYLFDGPGAATETPASSGQRRLADRSATGPASPPRATRTAGACLAGNR